MFYEFRNTYNFIIQHIDYFYDNNMNIKKVIGVKRQTTLKIPTKTLIKNQQNS